MSQRCGFRLLDRSSVKDAEDERYKGLGTSTTEDAQVYLKDLKKHEEKLIDLAFSKNNADARRSACDNLNQKPISITLRIRSHQHSVNRELVLFSIAPPPKETKVQIPKVSMFQNETVRCAKIRNCIQPLRSLVNIASFDS